MSIQIRLMKQDDVEECGRICYEAFKDIAEKHNFPHDIPTAEFASCADLCRRVHGFDRLNELKNIPPFVTSYVSLRDGRLTAYAAAPHFWPFNHAVAETEDDMHALLMGAGSLSPESQPITFLLPTRHSDLFRWCLKQGLRVVKPLTLMAMGEYQEPRGYYLPSVGY